LRLKPPPTRLLQKKINYDSLAVLPLGPICGICVGYAPVVVLESLDSV